MTTKYSGTTYRKIKQDVINLLKKTKGIKPSRISNIKFNKTRSKAGWKWSAIVRRKK